LSERGSVALAIAVAFGAWCATPIPVVVGLAGVGLAFLCRRPALLVGAAGVLAAGLAAHATAGLRISPRSWNGPVEVVRVSRSVEGSAQLEVRAVGHHLLVTPPRDAKALVSATRPGDRLVMQGRITPADPVGERNRGRHVAGFLHANRLSPGARPAWPWRVAGRVHDAVARLGRPLPRGQRALFDGFVLGDAGGQTAVQRADFQGAGLTHLLVASGENVAFLLTLAGPALRRWGFRSRTVGTLVLLVGFALVTGFEPSVLRAAAMAAIATTGAGVGRPAGSWRSLGLAVSALLLVDPFLVHSLAFGLSVGASAGIVALAGPITDLLAGPAWLRTPVGVTAAAQVGIAPLLLGLPGGLPVVTLPANALVAAPAAFVVVVGLPCLAIASVGAPGSGAAALAPRLLLGWIDGVARTSAALPLGRLGAGEVVVAVGFLAVALAARRFGRRRLAAGAGMVTLAACCWPALGALGGPASGAPVTGLVVVRRGRTTVVVLTGSVPAVQLLEGASAASVTHADLVVVPRGDRSDASALAVLAHRCSIGRVLAPRPIARIRWPVDVARTGERRRVGDATIDVVLDHPVLSVRVEPSGGAHDPG
jgi:competence protein ComEC